MLFKVWPKSTNPLNQANKPFTHTQTNPLSNHAPQNRQLRLQKGGVAYLVWTLPLHSPDKQKDHMAQHERTYVGDNLVTLYAFASALGSNPIRLTGFLQTRQIRNESALSCLLSSAIEIYASRSKRSTVERRWSSSWLCASPDYLLLQRCHVHVM